MPSLQIRPAEPAPQLDASRFGTNSDVCAALGLPSDVGPQHTSITLLPETIVSRKADTVLTFLAQYGFRPVWSRPFRFDANLIAAMRESGDRPHAALPKSTRTLLEMVEGAGESLFILVERQLSDGQDASIVLSTLKGSVFPGDRSRACLRSVLCSQHPTLKFIHCPDEHSAFLHELGVIARHSWLPAAAPNDDVTTSAAEWIARLYRCAPYCALDLQTALESLQGVLDTASVNAGTDLLRTINANLRRARQGALFDWHALFDPVDRLELAVDPWDRIVICILLTRYDWTVELDDIIAGDMTLLGSDAAVARVFNQLQATGFHGTLDNVRKYVNAKLGSSAFK